jgi:hypothetical protein
MLMGWLSMILPLSPEVAAKEHRFAGISIRRYNASYTPCLTTMLPESHCRTLREYEP